VAIIKYLLLIMSVIVISNCAEQTVAYTDDNCFGYDSRSRQCIKQVFQKNQFKLDKLYKTELSKNPALRGKIVFNIHLDREGNVNNIIVKNNEIESKSLVKQLVQEVETFNFFNGNEFSFHFPLILNGK